MPNQPIHNLYEIIDVAEGRFGKKVYATIPIIKDTLIIRFTGEPVDFARTLELGDKESFALQVSQDKYLYLDPPARFFNHSCEPNCGLRPDMYLLSLRDIAAGEELNYDYSTTMLERHWTMDCHCGQPSCRKIVQDFDLLPKDRRDFYIGKSVVQQFIVNTILLRK